MSENLVGVPTSSSNASNHSQSHPTSPEQSADNLVHDLVAKGSMEDGPGRGSSGHKTMASPARRSLPETDSQGEKGHPSPTSHSDDVIWSDVPELRDSCWAEWQFPVFVVLCASVGFLAVSFVMLLWLKSQMLLSKKHKDCEEPELESDTSDSTDIEAVKSLSTPAQTSTDDGSDGSFCHPAGTPAVEKSLSANVLPHALENVEALLPEALRQSVVVASSSSGREGLSTSKTMGDIVTERQAMARLTETRSEPLRPKCKGLLERRGSSASLTIDLLHPSQENISTLTAPTRECTTEEYLLSAGNVLTREQLRGCLRDVHALHREFWDIPSNHIEQVEVAGSGTKNRYRGILPNEHSRVRISPPNSASPPGSAEDQLARYINANYVKGYEGEERAYIATQGPLNHTVQDFWLMVWGERVPAIVMITKLIEKCKTKCEPYIPLDQTSVEDRDDSSPASLNQQTVLGGPGATAVYGDITVSVQKVSPREGYAVRELEVKRGDETRLVQHYWYDTWPDHKTPPTAHGIVDLVREVESERQRTIAHLKRSYVQDAPTHAPVVVHCSAGIGRTGCFLAVAIGTCQLAEENSVDILGTVCRLRHDRGGMVQTAEQYEFIHRALCLFEKSLPDQSGE